MTKYQKKRKYRRLSLIKNWRLVKKTRVNGLVYYNCEYKDWFPFTWNTVCSIYDDIREFNTLEEVNRFITDKVVENASDHMKLCGNEVASSEIIKLG